jgi:hypothetical protein
MSKWYSTRDGRMRQSRGKEISRWRCCGRGRRSRYMDHECYPLNGNYSIHVSQSAEIDAEIRKRQEALREQARIKREIAKQVSNYVSKRCGVLTFCSTYRLKSSAKASLLTHPHPQMRESI